MNCVVEVPVDQSSSQRSSLSIPPLAVTVAGLKLDVVLPRGTSGTAGEMLSSSSSSSSSTSMYGVAHAFLAVLVEGGFGGAQAFATGEGVGVVLLPVPKKEELGMGSSRPGVLSTSCLAGPEVVAA